MSVDACFESVCGAHSIANGSSANDRYPSNSLSLANGRFYQTLGPKSLDGKRTPRLYSEPYAQHLVQSARAEAKLPSHITIEACRHGGMTELGDFELTEQEIMSLSGHLTPAAARLYVKRTERQRLRAAIKRRDGVDARTKTG